MFYKQALHLKYYLLHNKHFSKAVKDAGVKIPVGVVGAVTDPKLSDELIGAGYADYVVMARAVIADPDWAKKAREGRA